MIAAGCHIAELKYIGDLMADFRVDFALPMLAG